ncbi:RNA polymerase factor sigma-54 [Acinetobacter larvae]|uniref:RNA polymerase sigma-54 factor n=1 Tax=Acinetobacter larvae TaxID=1789224 RepID=A0A1B2M2F8_9GAMM|nr:RNA polymerase factor sigma-54 [Acinetobacter larvae]AOA59380.1 RNA polymerase factor sigma-54 [Acinetobacter larvae]
MKLSLGLKVANSLSLTPQLQQAIRLLQLSSLELEQEVQEQLELNPLLEKIEEQQQVPLDAVPQTTLEAETQIVSEQLNADHLPNDLPVDTQWDDIYTHQSTALERPEYEEREDNHSVTGSLKQHMLQQLQLLNLSSIEKIIAYCLVDALDERGYLEASLDEVLVSAQQLLLQYDPEAEQIELDEIKVVLKHLQRLEPVGVGATHLTECLKIQLDMLPIPTPYRDEALRLLGFEHLFIANDLNKLLKQSGLNAEQLKSAIRLLKTLAPYPGRQFNAQQDEYQIPDVVVTQKQGRWQVQLNPDIVPKLRVNPYYANMIRRADQSSDNQYLRQHMLEAKNFIKGIDERHKTLLKVASCIVAHQRRFLELGPEGMIPLVLRDIAEEVSLHESTVSRVTTNKYLLTPRGLFELKYFFSSHVATSSGGEISSTAIRAKIKKLIAEENPRKPLSDNAIANLLQQDGIDVARRTIAKYRESLHIPASSDRKVLI